ncbi:hypothetical protein DJ568_15525 [Mucilaginibacter hurinus]|uniref:Phage portal protein n=1 Tax=Mucilaginibacter hurinus TaxID=2201324 RepID=A0A367GLS0_9SPHI|nr:hypothetical protein [Mucilaginibacter hurinus]RCH53948.1 hypothetical protein DJ568_15525 [Mucilaginibacter hurinus]
MKIQLIDIEKRIILKDNNGYGIVNYDVDNAYPQRIKAMIRASGTASQCSGTYSRFIEGEGFKDKSFYKALVNGRGVTMDKLLRSWAIDYAELRGFAVHINYNALYQPAGFNILPFENCRLPNESNDKQHNRIAVYPDWAKLKKRSINEKDIAWIDRYNPDPEMIEAQIRAAGGWQNYKGQVFWYSADGYDEYPLAPADPVLEDIDTDAQIKTFRNNSVRSGFLDHMLFIQKGKFESESERGDFKKDLKEFQGAKKSTQIFLVEVESDDEIPELKPLQSTDPDKKFELTNRTTKDAIIENYGIPPVLLNALVPGKLGTATEIEDAVKFYNKKTSRERILMEETALQLCQNFNPVIAPAGGDYSITEFTFSNGSANNN